MTSKNSVINTESNSLAKILDDDSKIVEELKQLQSEFLIASKIGIERAIRMGELLTQQKTKLGHGNFTRWVSTYLPFTDRTARNYMNLYQNREQLKTESVSVLTEGYKLLSAKSGIEKPTELFELAKEKALLLIGLLETTNSNNTESIKNYVEEYGKYKNCAISAFNVWFQTAKEYQAKLDELEATGDHMATIQGYDWLEKAMFTTAFNWSSIKISEERVMGAILNSFKKEFPQFYKFLETNKFSYEACTWLVDASEQRLTELEKLGVN